MKLFSRTTRYRVMPKRRTAKPRLEALDERQLLSGFGPADGAYIVEPWIGGYTAVQIQPVDQKIVAAGDEGDSTGSRIAIARYDSLGNPDNAYGTGGPSIPPLSGVSAPALGSQNEVGYDLVLQPNGKAVVAGEAEVGTSITQPASFVVARFNTDGTLDGGFGSGGWNTLDARYDGENPAESVGLQSTGKVVAAGYSLWSDSLAEVARFTASGAVDSGKGGFGQIVQGKAVGYTLTQFGTGQSVFFDLAVQPDDKVVAVGGPVVARYTASGTLDKTFNGIGYSSFAPPGFSRFNGWAVTLQSNGKIVVTGQCDGTDGGYDLYVARYNSNGTIDTSFGGGSGYVRLGNAAAPQSTERGDEVAIQPDGKIVVLSSTSVAGNPSNVMVARFNVDGTPDLTFAPGGYKIGAPLPKTGYHSFSASGMALQSDGSIIVCGNDNQGSSGGDHPLLMRFFPTQTSGILPAGSPTGTPATATLTIGAVKPLVTAAIARRRATGADVATLRNRDVRIADPVGATVGLDSGYGVTIDDSTVDWGWFAGGSSRRGRKAHPAG
jgi:uncharacterized delta-60 repeat protein